MQFISNDLKKCRTEEDIDALFDKYKIQDFQIRNTLLRQAMNCTIIHENFTSPRMKREKLSPEELEKRYYQTEKRTFLSISGFYDAMGSEQMMQYAISYEQAKMYIKNFYHREVDEQDIINVMFFSQAVHLIRTNNKCALIDAFFLANEYGFCCTSKDPQYAKCDNPYVIKEAYKSIRIAFNYYTSKDYSEFINRHLRSVIYDNFCIPCIHENISFSSILREYLRELDIHKNDYILEFGSIHTYLRVYKRLNPGDVDEKIYAVTEKCVFFDTYGNFEFKKYPIITLSQKVQDFNRSNKIHMNARYANEKWTGKLMLDYF